MIGTLIKFLAAGDHLCITICVMLPALMLLADDRQLLAHVLLRLEPTLDILPASSGRQKISLLQTLPQAISCLL
ncbi:MAG: hypothetical protein ABW019_06540 [Chitinophagaceae bacterium]